jgi:hypothetical protein
LSIGNFRRILASLVRNYAKKNQMGESPPIRIREVKIGRELVWVEFAKHEHALAAVRELNETDAFGPDLRLIAGFAVEEIGLFCESKSVMGKGCELKRMRPLAFADNEPYRVID